MTGKSKMLEEIREQPVALERTLRMGFGPAAKLAREVARRRPKLIVLAARGTSDNAAQFGRYLLEISTGIPVSLAAPSLFTLFDAKVSLKDAKDIAKLRGELLGKFVQVKAGNGIIAFWSDNEELKDLEFGFAVMDVRSDFENNIQQVPDRFLFTVFGSHWRNVRLNQQLYCKPLAPLAEPFSTWAAELENATVADCIAASFHRLGKG